MPRLPRTARPSGATTVSRRSLRWLPVCALALAASLLPSCGSGVIGGIFAGRDSRSSGGQTPDVRVPQLLLEPTQIPIIEDWIPPNTTLTTLRILNYVMPSEADAKISIAAPSVGLTRDESRVQVALSSVDTDARTTTLRAFLDMNLVRVKFFTKPDSSVDALVFAEIDGIEIGKPAKLRFVEPGEVTKKSGNLISGAIVVSVEGTSQFRVESKKLFAPTKDAAQVELAVLQRNFQVPRLVNGQPNLEAQRRVSALGKMYSRDPDTGISSIRGVAPAARFPGIARILLRDPVSGVALDTVNGQKVIDLPRLLYVPSLRAVGPGSLPVEGGVQARLVGRGLVPAENDGEFRYLFDRVSLSIEKGNARTDVRPEAIFRDESSEQVIVFRMPEAPDGLPGSGSIVLDQKIGDSEEVFRSRLTDGVRFSRSDPRLGPYVSQLTTPATQLVSGRYRPSSPFGDDAVIMWSDTTGAGRVTLLRNQGSGLFRSIGASIATDIKNPLALESAPFDAQGAEDLFVVGGTPVASKTEHGLLLSQDGPGTILEAFRRVDRQPKKFETTGAVADSATADFDGDGTDDLVVLRSESARRPIELWTTVSGRVPVQRDYGTAGGGVRSCIHVADLDGDDKLDVAYDEATATRDVVILYGDGKGGFTRTERVRWGTNPALTSTTPTILTSVRARTGSTVRRHLVVGAEIRSGATAVAWVGMMLHDGSKFSPVSFATSVTVETSLRFDFHQVLDLESDGLDELVAISTNVATGAPLHSFAFPNGKPVLLTNGATDGERLINVSAVAKSRLSIGGKVRDALLVQHDDVERTVRVPSLSTFVVGNGRILPRSPRLPTAADPSAVVIADIDGDGNSDDVAWFDTRGLSAVYQAAPGVFEDDAGFDLPMSMGDVIEKSLVALQSRNGTKLAWIENSGRIAVLDPRTRTVTRSGDLRKLFGSSGSNLMFDERCELLTADPNEDGIVELVAFLRTKPVASRSFVRLAFFRGVDVGAFPFVEPKVALELDSSALAPRLGNMLAHSALGRPGLEVTYDTGDSVHFATLDLAKNPGDDLFVDMPGLRITTSTISQSPVLVDLDGDQRDDVAVLAPDARGLQVWFNRLTWTGSGYNGQLVKLGGSLLSFPGDPVDIRPVDMNGDGLRDLLVIGQIQDGQSIRPVLTLFRNLDRGALALAYVIPSRWFGDSMPASWAALDLDGNRMTDLVFGSRILLCR